MPVERRGQVTRVLTNFGQLETGGTEWLERKVATFNGWHEPCDWRQSSTDLWEARGAIPRVYSASYNASLSQYHRKRRLTGILHEFNCDSMCEVSWN